MNLLNCINQTYNGNLNEAVKYITNDLGITVKDFGNLVLFKYDQIDSPKKHPIVKECRGIILDKNTLEIICRPPDRFFNFGEDIDTTFPKEEKFRYFEKLDGSIIKIFYYEGAWQIATQASLNLDIPLYGCFNSADSHTFKSLVYLALNLENDIQFQEFARKHFVVGFTYIFEITSPFNRIVKKYKETKLTLLCIRNNSSGDYDVNQFDSFNSIFNKPIEYFFNTIEEAVEASKSLKNLDEGFIVYSSNFVPCYKIKSPLYVQIHHMRGELGLTPKRIKNLILIDETEEYLSYFPDEKSIVDSYLNVYNQLLIEVEESYEKYKDSSLKEIGLDTKNLIYSCLIFGKIKNQEMSFSKLILTMLPKRQIALFDWAIVKYNPSLSC